MPDENPWRAKLRDTILDNSSITDGLTDDEAQPLIEWGLVMADRVTQGLPRTPDPAAEARLDDLRADLPRLMKRISWIRQYREKKGPEWTLKTLGQLNEMNQHLHGDAAPQLDSVTQSRIAHKQDDLTGFALLQDLMQRLTPPADDPTHTQPQQRTDNHG